MILPERLAADNFEHLALESVSIAADAALYLPRGPISPEYAAPGQLVQA